MAFNWPRKKIAVFHLHTFFFSALILTCGGGLVNVQRLWVPPWLVAQQTQTSLRSPWASSWKPVWGTWHKSRAIDLADSRTSGRWTLRWVHLGLMLRAVLLAWAWEPGFLSSCTPLLGLEILNIVVLSPVNEHKEDDLARGRTSKEARVKDAGCRASDGSHMAEWGRLEVIWNWWFFMSFTDGQKTPVSHCAP